jgi:hypothetical protein
MKRSLISMLAILIATACMAQSSLKATQINIFKNGTYFVVKEGNLPVRDHVTKMEIPAAPLLSTFWLNTTKDNKISDVMIVTDTLKKNKVIENYFDLLSSNKGKKIKFVYKATDKDLREVSGVLQDFVKSSGLIKIKQQDNKFLFVSYAGIVELSFEEAPVDMVVRDSVMRLAKVRLTGNAANVDLKLNYMQTGIQWMPSYNIKIVNDKELQLEMKALVENYAEPIENADLTLTVGNPQFLYGTKADPLAFNYLTNLYDNSQPKTMAVQFQAQMYNNAYVADERTAADANYVDYTTFETEGEKTNDLYMYKLGKVTLPYESKSEFQIFSVNINYKDVYEVNLADVANYSYYSYISNDPEQRYDVFHSLLLTNSTNYPFTTAPVFVQNENLQPLAQDRIKYTPTGANVSVQLSKAGDVVVKNKEEESAKADNVKKLGKTYYNKVTIKGTVYLENLQDKKIQLNVNKSLTATVTQAGDNGKISKSGKYNALNPYSTIAWEIPLGSKEKKTITYEYDVYVNAGTGN